MMLEGGKAAGLSRPGPEPIARPGIKVKPRQITADTMYPREQGIYALKAR